MYTLYKSFMCTYIYTYRENLKGTKVRDRGMSPRHMHIMIIQNSFTYLCTCLKLQYIVLTYIQCIQCKLQFIYIYKNIL